MVDAIGARPIVGQTRESLVKWAAFCLVFFGLPVIMVSWEFGHAMDVRENQNRERVEILLERALQTFGSRTDTRLYYQEKFGILFGRFANEEDPLKVVAALRSAKRRFPRQIDFVVIDGIGRQVPGGNTLRFPIDPVRRLFSTATARGIDTNALEKIWGDIQPWFGDLLLLKTFPTGVFRLASHAPKRHFVGFFGRYPFGSAVVFLNLTPDWNTIVIRDLVKAINRESPEILLGVFDTESGTLYDRRFASVIGNRISPVLQHLGETPQGFYHAPEGSFAQQASQSMRFLAFYPGETTTDHWRTVFLIVVLSLFVLAVLGSWLVQTGRIEGFLSIRTKLLGLFFFSAGLPLIVTVFLAWDYAQERRALLEEQILRSLEGTLRQIDRRFRRVQGHLEREIVREMRTIKASGPQLEEQTIRTLQRLRSSTNADDIWISSQEGKMVAADLFPGNEGIKLTYKFGQTLHVNLLRNANHQDLKESGIGEDTMTSFASASGVDIQEFFAGLSQAFEEFNEVQLGVNRHFNMLVPVRDLEGVVRFMSFFSWTRRALEQLYLRFFVPQFLPGSPPVFLAAKPITEPTEKFTPRFQGVFRDGWKRAIPENPVVRYRVRKMDGTLLVTVIRGEELSTCQLGAMVSDLQIRKEISAVWKRLLGICGFILFAGYAFGISLGRIFLQPVGHLESGLSALQRRDFKKRLPVESHDELGLLLAAFNRMAEGMEDLELAKTLQENLFPLAPLQSGSIRAYGSCLAATRIGGDYFDYQMLKDNRMFFLIGDVSGHGSGAAMVVSIVKGIVSLPHLNWDPALLLGRLNLVLLNILKRKKMMTLLMGYVDIPTRTMVFANAGHIGPMIVRDGKTQYLEGQSWVLGMRKNVTYTNETVPLQPGDTVIYLTDGLSEARGKNGEQLGYDILLDKFPGMVRDTPEATEQQIRRWHESVVMPGIPQEDDITLLIIQA